MTFSRQLLMLIDYPISLTKSPASIGKEHTDRLRKAGFTDEGIHTAAVTAYFNFVNRIALGLGVDLEDEFRQGGA